jgi:hypothetical protein
MAARFLEFEQPGRSAGLFLGPALPAFDRSAPVNKLSPSADGGLSRRGRTRFVKPAGID